MFALGTDGSGSQSFAIQTPSTGADARCFIRVVDAGGTTQRLFSAVTAGTSRTTPTAFAARYTWSANIDVFTNGRPDNGTLTASAASGAMTDVNNASLIGANRGTDSFAAGAQYGFLGLAWNRALSDAEIASISANPWQLFAAPRPIFPAVAVGGGFSAAAGVATEADSAQGLALTLGLGTSTETDTALGRGLSLGLGLATETDTALNLSALLSSAVGVATETDTALSLTQTQSAAVGVATETDTALALTLAGNVSIAVGMATETDEALALEQPSTASTNNFAGPRIVWKGRINKRWWLRDEDLDEEEPPKAIKKAARAIEKLAKAEASAEKVEKVIAQVVASEPRIDWGAYFNEVAANLAAQQEQMREARRVQLAYIVAQAARVAQDEDDLEALLMLL